jgi:fructose-bisphosphate aldolase, class II
MAVQKKFLALRPENVVKKLGSKSQVPVVNSRPIFEAFREDKIIIMACNIRIKHAVPGILRAAKELDAIVGFELARSEGGMDGGYTAQLPDQFVEMVVGYAEDFKHELPIFIHSDHIGIKDPSEKAVASGRELIAAQIKAGFSSFAIDASHNEMPDNIRITIELAGPIQAAGLGLEAEVGEIQLVKEGGEITTVAEAVEFIGGLKAKGVHPILLATNNGSKHGHYAAGEEVHIDLKRTGQVYEAIKKDGVCIAQHGITGTPLNMVGQFADYGIRKGNVGTLWQDVVHEGLPPDLMKTLTDWAAKEKKDIKFSTKPFKKEIDSIPEANKKIIYDKAYKQAMDFMLAFRCKGSASKLLAKI